MNYGVLGNLIMMLFRKKCSLNYLALAGLWGVVFLYSLTMIGVDFGELLTYMSTPEKADIPFVRLMFLIFILVLVIWRKCTFNKNDFIRIAREKGITIRSDNAFVYFLTGWLSAIFKGSVGEMLIAAKITGPFLLPFRFNYTQYITPETLYRTDIVEIVSLFEMDTKMEIEMMVNKKEHRKGQTGIEEIDTVLNEMLEGVKDFHGTLSLSEHGMSLRVFGSSWLGGKFEKRIIKGISMHEKIHKVLKGKYRLKESDEFELKLNKNGMGFQVVKK